MKHAADSIKAMCDRVEKSGVSVLVVATDAVGDEIRQLNHAGCPGIDEQGYLGQIVKLTPSVPNRPEVSCQTLK